MPTERSFYRSDHDASQSHHSGCRFRSPEDIEEQTERDATACYRSDDGSEAVHHAYNRHPQHKELEQAYQPLPARPEE